MARSTLTVFFENPFWVGVYERIDGDRYEVCKITFGAEPKDYEVWDFLLKNWSKLKFSPPIKAERVEERKINPKRMQREIHSKLQEPGIGTKDKGYTDTIFFVDDGITGTTMKRPGFQKMIAAIEAGYISAVFVKDLSRLGRNYIEVGKLTEEFFPLHDVRLVAVSDGVDSDEGEDDFTPFKNIMNEYYAKDISEKRRIVNKMKGNAGIPLSPPPYGYIKNPDDPRFWVIDPEAAEVVRCIYRLALEGNGPLQIATALGTMGALNPSAYRTSKGISKGGSKSTLEPTKWNHTTVKKSSPYRNTAAM